MTTTVYDRMTMVTTTVTIDDDGPMTMVVWVTVDDDVRYDDGLVGQHGVD